MKLNKENILSSTNNGFDFFKFVIPELNRQGNKCKNIKNPFYKDTKPSLSIFNKSDQWFFKDHGDDYYKGDMFDFAAFHYNLILKTSFIEILKNINNDLNLNLSMSTQYTKTEKQLYNIRKNNKDHAIAYQNSRGLTKHEYFLQSNAYKKYPASVVFVNHNNTGFERRYIATEEELKEKGLPKTQFSGNKTDTLYISCFNKAFDEVFICEGPNNAISFAEIGKSAIATFGATNLPNANLLSKYISGKSVYLSGDGDEAGEKFNNELLSLIIKNKIPVKEIKSIQFPSGKDSNDLLLENTLQEYEKISTIRNTNKKRKTRPFPVHVFPEIIQKFISKANDTLKYPVEYLASSILFATSVATGRAVNIQIKKGWIESPILYIALVGRPGINKSHPLKFALSPILNIDQKNHNTFSSDFDKYEHVSSLSKKERENEGFDEPVKPILKQMIVNDFTPEALNEVHSNNKRGLGVFKDELTGWLNDFNRYHKGSDQQFWLSNWSGTTITVNRKTGKPIFIPNPFISVCGTIQPAILDEFAKDKMNKNGFTDRILFAYPENLKKPYLDDEEMSQELTEKYKEIIIKLYNLTEYQNPLTEQEPETLNFSVDAKKAFLEWNKQNTDLINDDNIPEQIRSLYSKYVSYISRFALLLQMLYWASGEDNKENVSLKALSGAKELIEYFKENAIRVIDKIENADNPASLNMKSVAKLLSEKGMVIRDIAVYVGKGKSTVGAWLKE
ncbi:MAG: DUF3987 domain-containing protein [Bacteroidales bacterium]|nr:DUF3987 domain-containing protein [Bacteroidales bacterium]